MKSRVKTLLLVLVPVTLALAVVAGIATGKGSDWAGVFSFCAVVSLLPAFIGLGVMRLIEVREFQQAGLRLGQVLFAVALLGLFVLSVGMVFFFSCSAYYSGSIH